MQNFTPCQTHLLQSPFPAWKSQQFCSRHAKSCTKPFHVLCQAQSAQRSSRKAAEAPSLDLKDLEKALSKDPASTRRNTSDERIAFIDSSPSPKTGSSARKHPGKRKHEQSVSSMGPVRQKGSKGGKSSKDVTERLSKVSVQSRHIPSLFAPPGTSGRAKPIRGDASDYCICLGSICAITPFPVQRLTGR